MRAAVTVNLKHMQFPLIHRHCMTRQCSIHVGYMVLNRYCNRKLEIHTLPHTYSTHIDRDHFKGRREGLLLGRGWVYRLVDCNTCLRGPRWSMNNLNTGLIKQNTFAKAIGHRLHETIKYWYSSTLDWTGHF